MERSMRRINKQVTEQKKIAQILDDCHCCRIGFIDNDEVYIVPLNYGYSFEDHKLTLYFHSAQEGRKIDLIKSSPKVGFEIDGNFNLVSSQNPCDFDATFHSIIGKGNVSVIEGADEKEAALQHLMVHHTQKGDWKFTEQMLKRVCVFKIDVTYYCCKTS